MKCFHCGKTLQQWAPQDDPKIQHNLISPDCEFLKTLDMNETKYMKLLICEEEPLSLTTGNIVTLDKMSEKKLSSNLNAKVSNSIITSNPSSSSRRILLSLQDINK